MTAILRFFSALAFGMAVTTANASFGGDDNRRRFAGMVTTA
jgi:hypothetical protein